MRIAVVLRVFSIFLLILSFFMLLPLLFGWYYGETELFTSFLIPVGINVGVFVVLILLTSRKDPPPLSPRGGFLFVTLTWFGAAASGALPFYLSGAIPRYVDAFFETMSALTTTGASILTQIEDCPTVSSSGVP